MTLVAVWRAEDRLMAIADTRIVRAPGTDYAEASFAPQCRAFHTRLRYR
jgi:hypothetical protein